MSGIAKTSDVVNVKDQLFLESGSHVGPQPSKAKASFVGKKHVKTALAGYSGKKNLSSVPVVADPAPANRHWRATFRVRFVRLKVY